MMWTSHKYLVFNDDADISFNCCIFHELQLSNDDADMENMGIHGLLAPLKAFGYATTIKSNLWITENE